MVNSKVNERGGRFYIRALIHILGQKKSQISVWVIASLLLALSSAFLAFLVGPLLRVIFGGETLQWSPILRTVLGEPPALSVVKTYLPWLITICSLLKAFSYLLERISRAHLVRYVGRRLRQHLLNWGISRSQDQRLSTGQGDLQHRLTIDVERFENWLDQHGASLIRDSVAVVTLVISTVALSGYIALVVFSIYPILIFPIINLNRRLKKAASGQLSTAKVLHKWTHYMELHLELHQAGRETDELHKHLLTYQDELDTNQARFALLQGLAPSVTEVLVSLMIASSLFGFTWGLENGWWSAEELISLFVCIIMLYQPVKSLGRAYQQWSYGHIILKRCLPGHDLSFAPRLPSIHPRDMEKSDRTQRPSKTNSRREIAEIEISIKQLTRGKKHLALEFSAHLQNTKLYCIKGSNGSGKTSLLKAIAHLIPYQGSIIFKCSVDEIIPVDQLKLAWLSQPAQIMVSDMMTLQTKLDSFQTLIHYLKRFSFPETQMIKLDSLMVISPLGGVNLGLWDWFESLSLGEKQKFALCMLLIKDSHDLYLFDEPEAHLDEQTLTILGQILNELAQRSIVIMVSHEPKIQGISDHIMIIDH